MGGGRDVGVVAWVAECSLLGDIYTCEERIHVCTREEEDTCVYM